MPAMHNAMTQGQSNFSMTQLFNPSAVPFNSVRISTPALQAGSGQSVWAISISDNDNKWIRIVPGVTKLNSMQIFLFYNCIVAD